MTGVTPKMRQNSRELLILVTLPRLSRCHVILNSNFSIELGMILFCRTRYDCSVELDMIVLLGLGMIVLGLRMQVLMTRSGDFL